MNENKDLLRYLYRKKAIQLLENVFVATNAFLFRRFCLDMAIENGDKFKSLKDFLEQVDPVQVFIDNHQKILDKSNSSTYTSTPAKVETSTAVPVRPRTPVSTRTEDLLDRWMIKE